MTTSAQLEVENGIYYLENLYSADTEQTGLLSALLEYSRVYDDPPAGFIINHNNLRRLYGILYFDLRK